MKEFLIHISTGTTAKTVYLPAFNNHTMLGAKIVNSAVPGVASSFAFKVGGITIATATVASYAAAGDVTSAVMDTTLATRKTPLTATVPLAITCDGEMTTATAFDVLVRLDDFALTRD